MVEIIEFHDPFQTKVYSLPSISGLPYSPPTFANSLNAKGIYICGIRHKNLLYPLDVGIGELSQRLGTNYKENESNGKGNEALFDLDKVLKNPAYMYNSPLRFYNEEWAVKQPNGKGSRDMHLLYFKVWEDMIFFPSRSFMNYVLNKKPKDSNVKWGDFNQQDALKEYNMPLALRLSETKRLYREKFYFLYSVFPDNLPNNDILIIEAATKWFLQENFNLFTIGHLNGGGNEFYQNCKKGLKNQNYGYKLDFSRVANRLYQPQNSINTIFHF